MDIIIAIVIANSKANKFNALPKYCQLRKGYWFQVACLVSQYSAKMSSCMRYNVSGQYLHHACFNALTMLVRCENSLEDWLTHLPEK